MTDIKVTEKLDDLIYRLSDISSQILTMEQQHLQYQIALIKISYGYDGSPEVKLSAGMMQKIARDALKWQPINF